MHPIRSDNLRQDTISWTGHNCIRCPKSNGMSHYLYNYQWNGKSTIYFDDFADWNLHWPVLDQTLQRLPRTTQLVSLDIARYPRCSLRKRSYKRFSNGGFSALSVTVDSICYSSDNSFGGSPIKGMGKLWEATTCLIGGSTLGEKKLSITKMDANKHTYVRELNTGEQRNQTTRHRKNNAYLPICKIHS